MIGQIVGGRYELVEEYGSDPVFDLYRGVETGTDKERFVRCIPGSEPRGTEFVRQIHALILKSGQVNHPGVERLEAAFQEPNGFYLVTSFTPGSVLETRLRRLSSLSVPATVSVAIELCEGLKAIHAAQIVHGDISPRTVLSTSNDGAKLLLPGLWRAYAQDHSLALAVHGQMAPYLAPEVTRGDMPTPQSDIYALGVLMWQVLVGRTPYYGDSPAIIAAKHANDPYPPLRSVAATVPVALDEIVKKCMDKDPLRRYGSAQDLLNDLRAVQDALRFGRKISWPIQGAVSESEVEEVAPQLNAVDGQPQERAMAKKEKNKSKREREPSDGVPIWLAGIFYVVAAMFFVFVGGWVFFNSQKPKLVSVPNLVDMQVEAARTELKGLGLKLRVAAEQVSESHAEGTIIKTVPGPDEDIREWQTVEAIVSKGSKFVAVPDFRGRTVEEAKKLAAAINLQINDTDIEQVRDKELDEGKIVSQIPEARKKVERYTRIKLKVSNGDKRVGSTRNSEYHTNRINMVIPADLESKDVVVRIDVTDDNGTRTLIETLMVPGQEVDERVRWVGDELIVRIFFDGELVKQLNQKPDKEEEGG
ncbi:MAG: protein kinase [Armatimonadetes bacterium]|nr:protein kinase [Armatimonadota bacterium]